MRFLCLALLLFSLSPTLAHAGRVANIEKLRAKIKDGFFGEGKASFTFKEGNTDKYNIAGTGLVGVLEERHLVFLSGGGEWEEANKKLVTSEALGHLRYNYEFSDWLWGELLQQVTYDKFARLSLRYLTGAGLRVKLYRSEDRKFSIFAGAGYLFEYERIAAKTTAPVVPADLTHHHRLGTYLALNYAFNAVVSLGAVAYYQPRFTHPLDDFHVYSQNEMEFTVIADRLSFFVSYDLEVDNEPPVFVKKVDHALTNGVKLKF